MPPPGAVWPATVKFPDVGFICDCSTIVPATRKVHVRAPVAIIHSRSDPAPESASVVTGITRPPRPPVAAAPKPCAVGKALWRPSGSFDGLKIPAVGGGGGGVGGGGGDGGDGGGTGGGGGEGGGGGDGGGVVVGGGDGGGVTTGGGDGGGGTTTTGGGGGELDGGVPPVLPPEPPPPQPDRAKAKTSVVEPTTMRPRFCIGLRPLAMLIETRAVIYL
jgi:hypothetical protein